MPKAGHRKLSSKMKELKAVARKPQLAIQRPH